MTSVAYRLVETPEEREKALEFINSWALKWHHCLPPPTEGSIIAAWEGDQVVGTVTLDFRDKKTPFYLESVYDFSLLTAYFPEVGERVSVVQGGRWFAAREGISLPLLFAMAEYCDTCSIVYMIAEGKEWTLRRLEEIGLCFSVLYGISPNEEKIKGMSPDRRDYYVDPPVPRLFVLRISTILSRLGEGKKMQ